MPSDTHPLLSGCVGSDSDSGSSDEVRRTADDEEEKVQDPKHQQIQHIHQQHDGHYSESESDSLEENGDGGSKVQVHFFRKRKRNSINTAKTLKVSVNVRVDSITDISLEKQTFTGDLWLFLLTVEDFDEGDRREEVLEFFKKFNPQDHTLHWGAVQNLIMAAESTDHPKPHNYQIGNKIGLAWRLCGEFSEAWELNRFPFDCQDLTASIMVRYPSDQFRMHFVRDKERPSTIRDKTFPSLEKTWEFPERLILWSRVQDRGGAGNPTTRQIINVTLKVRRNPWYYIYNIVCPMFMIVLMSGSSFCIPPEKISERLSASLTLVLAAVAYKYNVVHTVPHIGYLTCMDYYVLMCYLFLFFVVVENCAAFLFFQDREKEVYLVGFLSAGFFLCNVGFAWFAWRSRRWGSRISQDKLKRRRDNEIPLQTGEEVPQLLSPQSFCSHASAESIW